jgi:hypothetical protein
MYDVSVITEIIYTTDCISASEICIFDFPAPNVPKLCPYPAGRDGALFAHEKL